MSVIQHNELFDFESYKRGIDDAKANTAAFGNAVDEVLKRLKKEQAGLTEQLQAFKAALGNIKFNSPGAASGFAAIGQGIDAAGGKLNELKLISSGLADVVNINNATVRTMQAQLKGYEQQLASLKPAQADYKQRLDEITGKIREITPAIQAQNTALKSAKNSVSAAESSYRAMQEELGRLRTQLRDMPDAFNRTNGAINKNNKEAVALNSKIQTLDATLKNADKSMGLFHRNVGNYSGALKQAGFGVKSLVANIGLLVGIGSAFEALNFAVDVNKKFDSLNASIKLVSGSSLEYAKNQAFLHKTSEDLGLEITGLTGSFKTFYAAATTAGINTDKTRDIFLSVSQAAANLKLSQDDVNGVFTAFGQIASKGTVQAEELRGQIGERIPGAFSIAAKAMNVTQEQLGKLMKDGLVKASDFLPKFAAELEKTFGKTDRIEGMQASINRFQNALQKLVQSQGLTSFFSSIINGATNVIGFFTDLSKSTQELIEDYQGAQDQVDRYTNTLAGLSVEYDTLKGTTDLNVQQQDKLQSVINSISQIVPGAATAFDQYGNALDINKAKVVDFIKVQNQLAEASKKTALAALQTEADAALKTLKIFQEIQNKGGVLSQVGQGATSKSVFKPIVDEAGKLTEVGQNVKNTVDSNRQALVETAQKILQLGGQVTGQMKGFLSASNQVQLDVYDKVDKLQGKIQERSLKAQALFAQILEIGDANGKKLSQAEIKKNIGTSNLLTKQRNDILKEKADFEKKREQLLNPHAEPGGSTTTLTDKQIKTRESAEKKAEKAFEERINKQASLLKSAYEFDLAQNESNLIKKQISQEDFEVKKYELANDYATAAIANELSLGEKADQSKINDFKKLQQDKLNELEKFEQKELELLRAKGKVGGIVPLGTPAKRDGTLFEDKDAAAKIGKQFQSQIDAENKLFDLKKARRELTFQDEVDHLDRIKKINEDAATAIGLKDVELAGKFTDLANDTQFQKELLAAEREKELRKATIDAFVEIGKNYANFIQELTSARTEQRISELEDEKQREMDAAGNNANARLAIEKKFNAEILKEKIKQAKIEKATAIFHIVVDTAMAIMKALGTLGPVAGGIAAALIGAMGAVQIAMVASKPLPKFRTGTKFAPKGPAEVAEEGYELMERRGRMHIIPKRGIINLEGGEKIYTHVESQRIIERAIHHHEINQIANTGKMHERLSGTLREGKRNEQIYIMAKSMQGGGVTKEAITEGMIEAMKHQIIERNIWDERGYHKEQQRRNAIIKYQNNRYSS